MIQAEIARQLDKKPGTVSNSMKKARKKARYYVEEIAAHISYPAIRILERFLGWLWNKIYDGIVLSHVERLQKIAEEKEAVKQFGSSDSGASLGDILGAALKKNEETTDE